MKIDFAQIQDFFEEHGKAMIITGISMIIIMTALALMVFFAAVQGEEKVMVPNVTGKELSAALLEMQAKELYPKIQLRFSDLPSEKGTVLEQSPGPGAIVKAGRNINLVISRGAVIERVEDYTGQNIDEVKLNLQTLLTSANRKMVSIKEPPLYRHDTAPAGNILEQNPPAGTEIVDPIQIEVVVSKGPAAEKVSVPDIIGLNIRDTLLQITASPVVYHFTARKPAETEEAGIVVSQIPQPKAVVDTYSKVEVVMTMPEEPANNAVCGIYTFTLPEYAYLLDLKLEALLPSGARSTIIAMKYPGGEFTVPYETEPGATLILSVGKKEVNRQEIPAQ